MAGSCETLFRDRCGFVMTDRMIAFCGIDGAGKTTLLQEVSRIIADAHPEYEVVTSKHRSYKIRDVVSRRISFESPKDYIDGLSATWYAIASALDFSRFDALVNRSNEGERPRMILMDRYVDCFRAYAAFVNPPCNVLVDTLLESYPLPDLTIFVRVAAEVAWKRILKRPEELCPDDSYELLCRFDQAYQSIFEGRTDVFWLANDKSIAESASQIVKELESRELIHTTHIC
jgi:thymidylate kinase